MDPGEKQRRKQIKADLAKKAADDFERSLPTSRSNFKKLFDHLDALLGQRGCDHTNSLAKAFLRDLTIENSDEVVTWMADHGGYCDCEILANVEEFFE